MADDYRRTIARYINDTRRSLGALVGIAQGLLCDEVLSDKEIHFLKNWFNENDEICQSFPCDVIHLKVKEVLQDGIITEEERDHLVKVLRDLIGAPETDLAAAARVTELAYDRVERVAFPENRFCLTGDFVHGPRNKCETDIRERGGNISASVTKKLNYLIIGSLGSVEWKHGSFGTKVEKAMEYKRANVPIVVVQEGVWRECLKGLL